MTAAGALEGFFEHLYQLRPVDATFIGVHTHDHRLPDWSPAGLERARGTWEGLAAELAGHRRPLAPGDWEGVDIALAGDHATLSAAELSGRHFQAGNPSLASGEVAFGVVSLITRDFLPAPQRASWLLQRLRAVPRFLAGASATLAAAPLPAAWTARATREADATIRLLLEGVPAWCQAMRLEPDLSHAVAQAGEAAAGATAAFRDTLATLAVAPLDAPPAGEAHLALSITAGHQVSTPVPELLREADAAFREARDLLQSMLHAVGATSMAEVNQRLAARHPTPGEYLGAFRRVWEECRAMAEEAGLVTWPDFPIRYVPIPEWTRMAAPSLYYLFYRSPAPLDHVTPHDYVVTPIDGLDAAAQGRVLAACNDSVIKLNHVVHHGALGHHVQNWHAARSPSRIGRVAAVDCASRIAMLQGGTMAEGWACYATDLADEFGFLTAEERVAEQHSRLRQLARARVDLGFHLGHLSFDAAVRVYTDEAGMPAEAARHEVVKNSMFPGAAVMYWLGTRGIHALRAECAAREGSAFSLRRFHDTFLAHGSLPVATIQHLMRHRP